MIYSEIINKVNEKKKQIAILFDPDKVEIDCECFFKKIDLITKANVDLIFVGGSLIHKNIEKLIVEIKKLTTIPVILFPGSIYQVSDKADAILFLSLISGRNPEFLIGNHVTSANFIRQSNLEVIPTGYLLIEGGKTSSVEYISNTKPIPRDKTDIAVATAIAGEMLGMKLIYLDAGSGALEIVPVEMICQVKVNINIPLIIGGGIRTKEDAQKIFEAGADIIVVGTAFENNIDILEFGEPKDVILKR